MPALSQAVGAARSIARAGQTGSVQAWKRGSNEPLYKADNPLDVMPQADKVTFLQRLDAYTRSLDPRITQVSVSLGGVHDTVLVAASDGTWAGDIRPLIRLNVSVIIEHNGRRERGSFGGGGRTSRRPRDGLCP